MADTPGTGSWMGANRLATYPTHNNTQKNTNNLFTKMSNILTLSCIRNNVTQMFAMGLRQQSHLKSHRWFKLGAARRATGARQLSATTRCASFTFIPAARPRRPRSWGGVSAGQRSERLVASGSSPHIRPSGRSPRTHNVSVIPSLWGGAPGLITSLSYPACGEGPQDL